MKRFIFRSVATALVAAALVAAPAESSAQVRRSGGGSTDSTTRVNRSTKSNDSKSSAAQVKRSSSNSTSQTGSSQVKRSSSNSTSQTGSSQVNRSKSGSTNSSSSQVNRSTTSSTKSSTTQVNRSGDSTKNATTVRRSTSTTGTSTTGTVSGSGSSTTSGGKVVRSVRENGSSSAGTSSSSTARSATSSNGTGLTQISSAEDDPQVDRNGNVVRRNLSVTGKGLGGSDEGRRTGVQGSQNRGNEPIQPALNSHSHGQMRMDDRRDLYRIPPRDRDFMTYDRIGHFYRPEFHYFGYRVKTLPPSYRQMKHWGRSYYYCDDVYYTRYGSYYRVCRPPFGVVVDMTLNDLAFASVRFAYYHNVYRDISRLDSNYRTILQQNRIIAQNNALIAQQNSLLALNSSRALSAYEIADALNLVQSYAGIDTEYYYEDGVFYTVNSRGRYEVIVPPAGALIDQLPDDYDTIVLGGVEYYRVDDTVYRLTLVDGSPYLEVLGQLTGSLAQLY